jgi:hypothetical protein
MRLQLRPVAARGNSLAAIFLRSRAVVVSRSETGKWSATLQRVNRFGTRVERKPDRLIRDATDKDKSGF